MSDAQVLQNALQIAEAVAKILVPVAVVAVGYFLSEGLKTREVQVLEGRLQLEWIELALRILQDAPETADVAMRDWAVGLINHNLPPELRIAGDLRHRLVQGQAALPVPHGDPGADLLRSRLEESGSVATRVVAPTGLNMRSGPGPEHDIVGTVPKGADLVVEELRGMWARVRVSGSDQEAWVFLNFLEPKETAP